MDLQDNELYCRLIDAHLLLGQLLTESVGLAMPQALAFAMSVHDIVSLTFAGT